ncbi:uncharacterized protein LOC120636905 [Pararge aegeria]|nr:uncharacterized protein LOC120623600 [Pararge aegeria]XP_039750300.1 uncharacterized protein LOC120626719 [Pararge aegeria]XP_039750814.1 uncharacterized protein LOC120627039 [Pararge aegeria]XP_039751233.1 uncharacterized protein LOC120627323 [Pararge aegeria]XP_039752270.1 uncharacterized protein LOC120628112 [Pararge aegeria]XP_039752280.1 uncharacterized protein LOC120628122 [Pararge aegeria]XP_039752708.1 uncharacterized protein LOC120628416 [Pararge aegeria]XP_039754723.1 uncharacte
MDEDEKLIYLVQKYDCLFNVKAKTYSDKNCRKNAWQKVSGEMQISEAECQKRWKRIRDCYKKAIRLRQFKSGSARSNDKPIRFEKELEFLKPYLQNKPQTSNLESSEENDVNTDTDTNLSVASPSRPESQLSSHSDTTRKKSQPLSQMLFAQYLENKKTEEDPTDTFFLSMSKTVKRMPIQMQVLLKRQILLLVTDAEIKVASNEMCTFQPETTNINSTQANTSSSIGYTTELRTESESLQLQSNSTNCISNSNTYKMQPNTGYYTTQLPTIYTPSNTYSMQSKTSSSSNSIIPNQFENSTSSRYRVEDRMEDLDLPPSPYIPLPIGTTTRQQRDGDNDYS